ncbi:helix-turn-helix transcriptional regulator [Peribacillus loiseleuriae]|uniref:helix-turn-helix transcriptional regulator n=1 Tax=Peribacillus loiseleuriae TaxID=1679170 RepID=UPI00380E19BC
MKEAASKQIESILKDYHWMVNSILLERDILNSVGGNLTAKYGEEAAMPKASGGTSDPVFQEVKRREKRWKRVERYEKKVQFLQDRIHNVEDERENEVLHWLLEGKSLRWIAMHMGLSPAHVHRLKKSIVKKCSNETNGTKGA